MADNYLEKRAEELRNPRPKVVRHHPSLESLLKRNRSYRGHDASRVVSEEDLLKILEIVPWVASGMNALHKREYYDGLILCNRQLIGLLSSGWLPETARERRDAFPGSVV